MIESTVTKTLKDWIVICATASLGLGLGFGIIWVASVEGSTWAWWQMIMAAVLGAASFGLIAPLGFMAAAIMVWAATPAISAYEPEKKE